MVGRMKPSELLAVHRLEIRRIALNHRVRELRVFGSTARGQDTETSDLDLLVDPAVETSLFDIGAIQFEVSELLGIPVDVLTPKALPDHIREKVLKEAMPV